MQALVETFNEAKATIIKSFDEAISLGTKVVSLLNEKEEKLKEKEEELEVTRRQLEADGIQLTNDRFVFEQEKKFVKNQCENTEDIVSLNIGGQIESIAKSKLTSIEGSMLAAMFSGRHAPTKDKNGHYFLDRDPDVFKYILNYLRESKWITSVPINKTLVELIHDEFDYFCIPFKKPRHRITCQRKDIYSLYELNNRFFKVNCGIVHVQNLDDGRTTEIKLEFASAWKDYTLHNSKLYFLYENCNFYSVEIVSSFNAYSRSNVVHTDIPTDTCKPIISRFPKTSWFIFSNGQEMRLMLHIPSFNKITTSHTGIAGFKSHVKLPSNGKVFIVDYKVLKYNESNNSLEHQQDYNNVCQSISTQQMANTDWGIELPIVVTKRIIETYKEVVVNCMYRQNKATIGEYSMFKLQAHFHNLEQFISNEKYIGIQIGSYVHVHRKKPTSYIGVFYNNHKNFGFFGEYLCVFPTDDEYGYLHYMPDYYTLH